MICRSKASGIVARNLLRCADSSDRINGYDLWNDRQGVISSGRRLLMHFRKPFPDSSAFHLDKFDTPRAKVMKGLWKIEGIFSLSATVISLRCRRKSAH